MTNEQMVKAFNEWMRRFIDEPDRFDREFRTVNKFLADEAEGREPSYGETSAMYLTQLVSEQAAAQ